MANSLRNNLLRRCAAAARARVVRRGRAAPAHCTNQEIVLEASPVDIDYRNNNAVLRDVVITQCATRIEAERSARHRRARFREQPSGRSPATCASRPRAAACSSDKAVVSFRNNLISRATITGAPAQFEQQREDGTTARGHANTIDYETASGTVSFRDNAFLSDGRNEINGQQLRLQHPHAARRRPVADRHQAPATAASRIMIQPKGESGNPLRRSPDARKTS